MWCKPWADLGRIVVVAPLAYVALVTMLRISGTRALSKPNAFELVVTVALGSTLATVLLSTDVSRAEGVLALAVLVMLLLLVSRASLRSRRVERLVKSEPAAVPVGVPARADAPSMGD